MDPTKIEPKQPITPDVSLEPVNQTAPMSSGRVEEGTTRVEAPVNEYVQKSPELQRPEIATDVAQAGVTLGQDNIVINSSAIASGVTPANPQISQFKGITLPIPIEEAREIAKKGDSHLAETGIATIEVMQTDRAEAA